MFLTKLSGNKFVNAAIFGGAEALSVLFSGYLMSLLSDISVFRIIFVAGMLCYLVIIFMPDVSTIVIYISNCVFVGSMGGWQNLGFLIAEMRVPPQSLGSVNMLAQTVGIGTGIFVPFISLLDGSWPLIIGAIFSCICFTGMFWLPAPGAYLP